MDYGNKDTESIAGNYSVSICAVGMTEAAQSAASVCCRGKEWDINSSSLDAIHDFLRQVRSVR